MLRDDQLECLRCPVTGRRLEWMGEAMLARFQEAVAASAVVNRRGDLVVAHPEAAMVSADAQWAYVCRDGIPVLIADEAVAMGQLEVE